MQPQILSLKRVRHPPETSKTVCALAAMPAQAACTCSYNMGSYPGSTALTTSVASSLLRSLSSMLAAVAIISPAAAIAAAKVAPGTNQLSVLRNCDASQLSQMK